MKTTNKQEPLGGDLHRAIMNLPCDHRQSDEYKRGHRDARHAAAELVSAALSQQAGAAGASESIDTPEFWKSVRKFSTAPEGTPRDEAKRAVLAHIDAAMALKRTTAADNQKGANDV